MPKAFSYLFLGALLAFTSAFYAQQKTITGTVRDTFNQPLPGANIVVLGTTRGVITNSEGLFEILALDGETLSVSYVGYLTQTLVIEQGHTFDIILKPGNNLQEVVVWGYGSTTRQVLTDNIASVNSGQIKEIPVPSLQGALVGKAAGVQITQVGGRAEAGFKIRVRGIATVSGSQEPLYVIDGVPLYKNDLSLNFSPINDLISINPADIESVEILKDASAAAIYGSRATNGVVLITTKSGKRGKTKFSLNTSFGWSEASNKLEFLSTEEYVELYTEAAMNSGFTEDDVAFFFNLFSENEADWREGLVDTDWQDLALISGSVQDINFSASGGEGKTTFFLSTGYNNTKGILRGNTLERYTLRANLEHTANSWLTIGLNSNLSKTQLSRLANDLLFANPTQGVVQIPFSRPFLQDGVTPNTETTLYYNFLMDLYNGEHEANIWRAFAKVHGQASLTRDLFFRSELGYDFTDQMEERFFGSLTGYASTNGYGDILDAKEEKYVLNNYFQYQLNRDQWHLESTLGMSYEELLVKGVAMEGQDFPSDQLRKLGSAGEITGGTTYEHRESLVSYFARANARLFDRWLLKASIRIDGSSRFGSDSKYGTFPAASLGWLASNEPFLKDNRTISNLKLRASWGITGNSNTNPFASRTEFNTATYKDEPGFILERLGDPGLTWEKTAQFNTGLDLGILDNRALLSFDYYNKQTDGLLFGVPVPSTSGVREVVQNLGEIQNRGFEWVLDTKNIRTEDFSWDTSLNLAINTNEVKSLPNGADIIRPLKIIREGETVASWFMVEYAGVDPDNGDALFYLNTELSDGSLDRTTTNNYNEASRKILGSPFPDLIGGLTNNFRFREIDFSFTFQGEWGAQFYNGGSQFQSSNADFFDNQTRDQLNRWQQPGDMTDIPQARLFGGNGSQESSRYLENADFVRLRNLTLGFTLPVEVTNKLGLDRLRIYFTGVNLFTFTNFSGWDPESTGDFAQWNSAASGYVFFSPPQARTLTLGLNVDF